jgi:hypothetical protein
MELGDLSHIINAEERMFSHSCKEVEEWITQLKKAADEDAVGNKKYELLLVEMIAFISIYRDIDVKRIEDVYYRIIEQEWQDEDHDLPFDLKVEYVVWLFTIYQDINYMERAIKILEFSK